MDTSAHNDSSLLFPAGVRIEYEPAKLEKLTLCRRRGFFLALTYQQREDSGQQHEDQRLNKAYQQLKKIKRNRQQPAQAGNQRGHGFQHVFAREGIAIETKTQ